MIRHADKAPLTPTRLYVHIDPVERQVVYVGKTKHPHRPFNFRSRGPAHAAWLQEQMANGHPRESIAHVVWDGLRADRAARFEIQLISYFRPIFNVVYNQDVPLVDGKYRVLPASLLEGSAAA